MLTPAIFPAARCEKIWRQAVTNIALVTDVVANAVQNRYALIARGLLAGVDP